jgi:chromosome segregation ATPase
MDKHKMELSSLNSKVEDIDLELQILKNKKRKLFREIDDLETVIIGLREQKIKLSDKINYLSMQINEECHELYDD